jgi:hypothetical protein
MATTNRLTRKTRDGKREPSAQTKRGLPPSSTKIKPLDQKVGEGAGNLRGREEAFKRRHGTTKS